MAKHKAKTNKFITGAVTAAMVATAVVPVAAAAETKGFSDVPASNEFAPFIKDLTDRGIIKGYTDGTFKPAQSVSRSNAVKMLGRVLEENGKTAPADWDTVERFSDVPVTLADKELVKYAALVKDNNVFNGHENGTLDPLTNISRQHMATVLVRALNQVYGLDLVGQFKAADFKSAITDMNTAGEAHVESIIALEFAGMTTVTNFRPTEVLNRAQFSKFLSIGLMKAEAEVPGENVEGYKLQLSSKSNSIDADGGDNTVITATIYGKDGKVATEADDLVLKFDATYGQLANTRVTVQDGVATVLLTSEFSPAVLNSVVTARVIEAAPDSQWVDEIGKENFIDSINVKFVPKSGGDANNPPLLTGAESNQADRVTVFFDKEVTPATFKDGIAGLQISQDGEGVKAIAGYLPVKNNPKAVTVLLEVDPVSNVLTDNKKVYISDSLGNARDFILTDARQPEATSVEKLDYNQIEVTFSESIADVNLSQVLIDGGVVKIAKVENGKYTLKGDNRNKVIVTTEKFIKSGKHSIQLTKISDYAGLSDPANVSSNQILDFEIEASDVVPAATAKVESPEQIRVELNTFVEDYDVNAAVFQVHNDETKEWEDLPAGLWKSTEVLPGKEYLYELTEDWTVYYDTKVSGDNYYNHKFRIAIEKDSFENPANEKKNLKQEIGLNYDGSALNTPDNKSPELVGTPTKVTDGYIVQFDEPVKNRGLDNNDTPSQLQGTSIPQVVVEFIGTDKAGKKHTINGTVNKYASKTEDSFHVSPDESLQGKVDNEGFIEDWELVVRNVTDDVGNAATTLTQKFTVAITPSKSVFMVKSSPNGAAYDGIDFYLNGTDADQIVMKFTSSVQYVGNTQNALNASNYTLNGLALPKGTTFTLADLDGNEKNGYEAVTITLPEGTLDESTNVLNISKDLTSANGLKISGLTEIAEAPKGNNPGLDTPVTPPVDGTLADLITAGAAEIQTDNVLDTLTVVLTADQLPAGMQGAESYTLTVGNKTILLLQNKYNDNKYNATVSSTEYTEAELKGGTVTANAKVEETLASMITAGSAEIQEDNVLDTLTVVLTADKLSAGLQGGTSYTLTVGTTEIELNVNKFNSNKFNATVSSNTYTKAQLEAGKVTKN